MSTVHLEVNGESYQVDCEAWWMLVDLLRVGLRLTGTKQGCAEGDCGACAVQVDGQLILSCLVPAGRADGCRVRTVEGLGTAGQLSPLQQAFIAHGATQCGFCTPGVLMAATTLLEHKPVPTEVEVREFLDGNLCRCGAHQQIVRAVLAAGSGPTTSDSTSREERR